MILFNKEINFKSVPKVALAGVAILVIISLGAGGFLISQKMRERTSTTPTESLASEGDTSAEAVSGSHNECENNACTAKPGIGANDCNSDLDCTAVECANVTVDPAKPEVGASGVKFICTGSGGTSLVSAVSFNIEAPGSSAPKEYLCPSDTCSLSGNAGSYTATLSFPDALVKGTYKVMTKTCFNLFSGNKICSEYKSPTT